MKKKFIALLLASLLVFSGTECTLVLSAEEEFSEIQKGDENDTVAEIQKILIDAGYLTANATGYYGDMTVQAVIDFQSANGLEETGIVDANTYSLLLEKQQELIDENSSKELESEASIGVQIETFVERYNEATDYYNEIASYSDGEYDYADYITVEMATSTETFSPNNGLTLCVNPNTTHKEVIGIINAYTDDASSINGGLAIGEMFSMIYAIDPSFDTPSDALNFYTDELYEATELNHNGITFDRIAYNGVFLLKAQYDGFEIIKDEETEEITEAAEVETEAETETETEVETEAETEVETEVETEAETETETEAETEVEYTVPVEEMTLEELQDAYLQLQSEHEELQSEYEELIAGEETETETETEFTGDASDLVSMLEVTEYSTITSSENVLYVMVIKNNSPVTLSIGANVIARDTNGNMTGASSESEDAVESGYEACLIFYFDAGETFEYVLTAEEDDYHIGVQSDIEYEVAQNEKNIVVACTNNGSEVAEYVKVYALFFKNGKMVDADYTYCVDDDDEIKPGAMIASEISVYKEYDDAIVIVTGKRYL